MPRKKQSILEMEEGLEKILNISNNYLEAVSKRVQLAAEREEQERLEREKEAQRLLNEKRIEEETAAFRQLVSRKRQMIKDVSKTKAVLDAYQILADAEEKICNDRPQEAEEARDVYRTLRRTVEGHIHRAVNAELATEYQRFEALDIWPEIQEKYQEVLNEETL